MLSDLSHVVTNHCEHCKDEGQCISILWLQCAAAGQMYSHSSLCVCLRVCACEFARVFSTVNEEGGEKNST